MKLEGAGEKQRSAATPSIVVTHRFRDRGHWRGSSVTIESLSPRLVTFPLLFNNFEKSKTRNTNSFQFFVYLFLISNFQQ